MILGDKMWYSGIISVAAISFRSVRFCGPSNSNGNGTLCQCYYLKGQKDSAECNLEQVKSSDGKSSTVFNVTTSDKVPYDSITFWATDPNVVLDTVSLQIVEYDGQNVSTLVSKFINALPKVSPDGVIKLVVMTVPTILAEDLQLSIKMLRDKFTTQSFSLYVSGSVKKTDPLKTIDLSFVQTLRYLYVDSNREILNPLTYLKKLASEKKQQ